MIDKIKSYNKELRIATELAVKAGQYIMKNYGKSLDVEMKKDKDFVTKIDKGSEKIILNKLKKSFKKYSVYSEEAGSAKKDSEFMWIVDPLDGTTNFTIQNPFFNVAIGLAKNDEIVLGVVYYPVMKELYYAVSGCGAYLNGKKIKVRDRKKLDKGVFAYCHGGSSAGVRYANKLYSAFRVKNEHLRQMGAAALELCYVASGRLQGFFMNHMNSYDVGAGSLIAKEAGAVVTDFKGDEFDLKSKHILVAPKNMHKEILTVIKKVKR